MSSHVYICMYIRSLQRVMANTPCLGIIRESVDSLCRDDTDVPTYSVIPFKCLQTFKCLDSKAFWIAYCVSRVVFYP